MKIECTIAEYSNLVRNCDRGTCDYCALNAICRGDMRESKPNIEDVFDITIIKEKEQ